MKTLIKPRKEINQSAKVVALSDQQVSEVCRLLHWTAEQYYEHQYGQYELFLARALFSARIEVYNQVRYSPLMRGLWINEWIQRDMKFLPFGREFHFAGVVEHEDGKLVLYLPLDNTLESLVDEYEFIHNGKRLYSDEHFMTKFYHVLQLIQRS